MKMICKNFKENKNPKHNQNILVQGLINKYNPNL